MIYQGEKWEKEMEKDLYTIPFPYMASEQAEKVTKEITQAQKEFNQAMEEIHRTYQRQIQMVYETMGIKEIIK